MHREPDVGFDPGSPGSRPGPKAGAKPLRHPGIPTLCYLFLFLFIYLFIFKDFIYLFLIVTQRERERQTFITFIMSVESRADLSASHKCLDLGRTLAQGVCCWTVVGMRSCSRRGLCGVSVPPASKEEIQWFL